MHDAGNLRQNRQIPLVTKEIADSPGLVWVPARPVETPTAGQAGAA